MNNTQVADRNIRSFLWFRVFFNSRFYYPVLAVLFLDLGLSLEQYALLNVAWAAAIVLCEVPLGALADLVGRKKLVVTASILMIVEMLIFALTPNRNLNFLFWMFMLNRAISGGAEACASGADEALVFDSLKKVGREREWPLVLERLNKISAVSFFVAMIVGAAIYDPRSLNWVGKLLHVSRHLTSADVVRFPVYLTCVSAALALYNSLRMQELPIDPNLRVSLGHAFSAVARSYRWILGSPVALFVMLATLANDCFLRLFMTMTSKYFRLIHLPEISFGVIGSALALLGYFTPFVAKKFIALGTARAAYAALSALTFIGLIGLPLAIPYIGLSFVVIIGISMSVLQFMTSYYLNESAEPTQRATILSFKGLTSNLAYGGIGILFAALLRRIQSVDGAGSSDKVFVDALKWLPWGFCAVIAVAYIVRALRPLEPRKNPS